MLVPLFAQESGLPVQFTLHRKAFQPTQLCRQPTTVVTMCCTPTCRGLAAAEGTPRPEETAEASLTTASQLPAGQDMSTDYVAPTLDTPRGPRPDPRGSAPEHGPAGDASAGRAGERRPAGEAAVGARAHLKVRFGT